MSDTRTYRGSEAPLAALCGGSVNASAGEILIDSVNPAGTVGTVVHKGSEQIVNIGHYDWAALCEVYGLNKAQSKEVAQLVWAAKAFWDEHKAAFGGGIETERGLSFPDPSNNLELSGHFDVWSMPFNDPDPPDLSHVLDWKTTRLDIDYTPQMLFYAWLICLNYPKIKRVKTVVVFLRDRTANIKEWSEGQIKDFGDRYYEQVINWDGHTYRPGGHCAHCKRFASCPAHREMIQQVSMELIDPSHGEAARSLVDFYGRIQAVEVLAKKAREHVRSAVEQAGGELPGLKLVPSSRDTIDAKRAWPVLISIMEPDDFADAVEIKRGPLMEAVAKQAPRGKKKEAKVDLMEALKAADAVTTTEFKTLRVVQNKETEVLIGNGTEE